VLGFRWWRPSVDRPAYSIPWWAAFTNSQPIDRRQQTRQVLAPQRRHRQRALAFVTAQPALLQTVRLGQLARHQLAQMPAGRGWRNGRGPRQLARAGDGYATVGPPACS
jgi:hypothetical protein